MSVANTGADTTQAGGGTQGAEQSANGQPAQGQTQQTQQTPEGQQAQGQEQQQPGAKTETTEVVYNFKAPEDMPLDGKAVEQFKPLAKELGLKADGAQKLVDFYANQLRAQAQAHQEMQQTWVAEVTNDPEYGGAKLEESKVLAKAALDHIGDPKFVEFLNTSGLGNHPMLFRAFAKFGRQFAEDSVHRGNSNPGDGQKLEDVFFPSMKK